MIKKILNKIFYAVIIALVFSFINRGCAKALDTPFYLSGSLNFNIARYNSDSDNYYLDSISKRYDFTKLYEDNETYFNDYTYFFIVVYSNHSTSNYYLIDLYFSNNVSPYGSSNAWLSGNFKRLRYNTNILNTNDDILGSDTLTITNKIDESNQSYFSNAGYYGLPFYSTFTWSNVTNFDDDYAVPLIYQSGYSYYAIPKNPSALPRFVIFSNYSGNVYIEGDNGSYYQTYYSSYIGEEDVNYDIEFSIINSSDKSNELYNDDNHITGAGIAINYFPKDNTLYNYYYYWEPLENFDDVEGPPSDYDEWVKLEDSDKGIGALSVDSNGYLYAIITDKNNNLLSSVSLKYDKVGTLSMIPVNNNKLSTYLTKISDRINYGGPISSILTIPINFISNIYNSFSGSCSAFNLGSLLGTNIIFNCFTLESILGNDITNIIDMLCSFMIYYHLILFIISIYRKIMNLDDLDDYMPQHLYHPKHGSYDDYNG